MSSWRQVLGGFLVALISLSIVGGGISLAFQEGGIELAQVPASAPLEPTSQPDLPTDGEVTPSNPLPGIITATPIMVIEDSGCPQPRGWDSIQIKPGETLAEVAERYLIEIDILKESNCLEVEELRGGLLYVPPFPSLTPSPTRTPFPTATRDLSVCGPDPGWILYTVKPNDNLFRLSITYGITIEELRWANCLGKSNLINTGQELYVPPIPISNTETMGDPTNLPPTIAATETIPASPTSSPTSIPTITSEPSTATPTTESETLTPTITATVTPTDTPTPTVTTSSTPQPSPTATMTLTPTQTATLTPTEPATTATVPTGGIQQ